MAIEHRVGYRHAGGDQHALQRSLSPDAFSSRAPPSREVGLVRACATTKLCGHEAPGSRAIAQSPRTRTITKSGSEISRSMDDRAFFAGSSFRPSKYPAAQGPHVLAPAAPQIFGGSPGRSSSSCSLTSLGGGNKTISRSIARPFPLSFCANAFQHSEQISYPLPSISFCRQSLASPQRSQVIMDFSPRYLAATVLFFARTTMRATLTYIL
jgi:hypothetical protein